MIITRIRRVNAALGYVNYFLDRSINTNQIERLYKQSLPGQALDPGQWQRIVNDAEAIIDRICAKPLYRARFGPVRMRDFELLEELVAQDLGDQLRPLYSTNREDLRIYAVCQSANAMVFITMVEKHKLRDPGGYHR